jgi:hypothetical protein
MAAATPRSAMDVKNLAEATRKSRGWGVATVRFF